MPEKAAKIDPNWLRISHCTSFLADFQMSSHQRRATNNSKPRFQRKHHGVSPRFELWRHEEMTDLDQRKPGGKSDRRKQKRNKKAEQQQSPAPDQAQAASESIETDVAPETEVAPEEAVESVAAVEAAPAEPVERVASFRERMASVMTPADTAPAKPAAPADIAQASPSDAADAATGIQAIANAYRDYTRKSLEDAQSFAEKLTAARSLDKAVEAQTEFARQACETFADNSRKIRTLYRELFWQSLQFPKWPPGHARR
jgi:phasin family protein